MNAIEWQPIETAPKVDCATVLLCEHKEGSDVISTGFWSERQSRWLSGNPLFDAPISLLEWTHWMPLPEPPPAPPIVTDVDFSRMHDWNADPRFLR